MYQASISVNNAAVKLLERHQYNDAAKCFKGSLDLMKCVFSNTSELSSEKLINKYLTETVRNLAVSSLAEESAIPIGSPQVTVVYDEFISSDEWRSAAESAKRNRSEIAVHISQEISAFSAKGDEDFPLEAFNLTSGIILYNYAIAFKCCGTNSNNNFATEQNSKLMYTSLKMCELAYTLLSREIDRMTLDVTAIHEENEWIRRTSTLFVSMLVKNAMGSACLENGMFLEGDAYFSEVRHMHKIYRRLDRQNKMLYEFADKAAAAA